MRMTRIITLVLLVLFLLAMVRLARLQSGGPSHQDVELPGGEPATFYLPGAGYPFYTSFAPPIEKRPPAIVLVHGFTSDREFMSSLARRMTQNGYAVLAIDLHGHGSNRNPFSQGFSQGPKGALFQDIKQAVDYLRDYPLVDGSRIVVMGHSMGAGASLDFASHESDLKDHDSDLKGAVMISGGFALGPARPKNALFIFAENDPGFIRDTSESIAAKLAGVPKIERGKLYGDFAQSTAVEAIQVPGVDHVQILSSAPAAETIIKWLDSTLQVARTAPIKLDDPRYTAVRITLLLFLVLLVPLGRVAGWIVVESPAPPATIGGWWGLAIVAAALLAAMPLVAIIPPLAFIPLVVGDVQVSWFAVAGLIMLAAIALLYPLEWTLLWQGLRNVIAVAAIVMALIYVSESNISIMLHRMALTPERLLVAAAATLLMLPFWMSFEIFIRRGGTFVATIRAIAGRILILVLMGAGIALGVLSPVLMLILPTLILLFAMFEIFAASAYSTSRNLMLIAIVESAWFAWIIAATNPITFML